MKLQSKKSVIIPVGERVALTGYTRHVLVATETTLLVEPPKSRFPAGLLFCSYIMTSPPVPSFKVPVLVKNNTVHDIKVPLGHNIAELSFPKAVSSLPAPNAREPLHHDVTSSFATCNSMHVSDCGKLIFDFTDFLKSGRRESPGN